MADVSRLPAALVAHWDWQRRAACRGMDMEIFFHPDGERDPARARRVARARTICDTCPVADACRDWAHRVEEQYGIWGGESEDERRIIVARRRRSARQALDPSPSPAA